jgi:hypothetical protein
MTDNPRFGFDWDDFHWFYDDEYKLVDFFEGNFVEDHWENLQRCWKNVLH